MRRYLLPLALLLVTLLGTLAAPAYTQANGNPAITVSHHYYLSLYGFGIFNDTVSFSNPGSSSVQIPSLQLGVPDSVASRSAGLRLSAPDRFSMSRSENNGTALFEITPRNPNLAAHSTSAVSLESYVKDILNSTTSKGVKTDRMLLMIAPSISQRVDSLKLAVQLPSGIALKTGPAGFPTTVNDSGTFYLKTLANDTSQSASAEYFQYSVGDNLHFQPVEFFSATRTLTASAGGVPQISDQIVFKNLGGTALTSLRLSLVGGNVTSATVVPSSSPPLVNPKQISIVQGLVDLSRSPFPGSIPPGENYTLTLLYDVPSSLVRVSNGNLAVGIPVSPPVDGVVGRFVIKMSLPAGIVAVNSSVVSPVDDATPLQQGKVTYRYSLSVAWGAGQAVPISFVLFGIAFIGLIAYRQSPKEPEAEKEEEESGADRLLDTIKVFEDKLGLISKSLEELASKQPGTMGKTDFDKIRAELEVLRSKALQRLNEVKQAVGPGRLFDLLTQIHDTAREEDRAAKDLINLYEQYQTRKMREETFQKLLPSYRRRLNGATNHLSDLLNTAQKEASSAG